MQQILKILNFLSLLILILVCELFPTSVFIHVATPAEYYINLFIIDFIIFILELF